MSKPWNKHYNLSSQGYISLNVFFHWIWITTQHGTILVPCSPSDLHIVKKWTPNNHQCYFLALPSGFKRGRDCLLWSAPPPTSGSMFCSHFLQPAIKPKDITHTHTHTTHSHTHPLHTLCTITQRGFGAVGGLVWCVLPKIHMAYFSTHYYCLYCNLQTYNDSSLFK